jgi:hypothetical protein
MSTGRNYSIRDLDAILSALGLGGSQRSNASPHPLNTSYAARWGAEEGLYVFADIDVVYVQMDDDNDPRWTAVEVAAGAPPGLQVRSLWELPGGAVVTVFSTTAQYVVVMTDCDTGVCNTYTHSSAKHWRRVLECVPQAQWARCLASHEKMLAEYDAACARSRRQCPRWGSVSLSDLGRAQTQGRDIRPC